MKRLCGDPYVAGTTLAAGYRVPRKIVRTESFGMSKDNLRTSCGFRVAGFEQSRNTARAAAEQAVQGLGMEPSFMLTFGSPRYEGASVLAGISDVASGVPLVGASCAFQVADRLLEDSLVVLAVHSPFIDVRIGLAENFILNPLSAVDSAVSQITGPTGKAAGHATSNRLVSEWQGGFILAIFPPIVSDESTLCGVHRAIARLRESLPDVSAMFGFGATSSSNTKAWQLAKGECFCQGLILAYFRTGLEFGLGFAHGLIGEEQNGRSPLKVIDASRGVVTKLSEQPLENALGNDVENRFLCKPSRSAAAVLPIRLVPAGDSRNGLVCEVPLEVGAELSVPSVNVRRLVEAAGRAVNRSLGEPTVRRPQLTLVLGSRWRHEMLGDTPEAEIETVRGEMPGVRLVGIYTDNLQVIFGRGYEACCNGVFGALTIGEDVSSLYKAISRSSGLLRAAHEMLRAMDPEAVFQGIADAAYSLLECKSCTLRLLDDLRQQLVLKAARGVTEKHHRELYPDVGWGRSIVGKAVAEEKRIIEPNLRESSLYEYPKLAAEYDLNALFCQPVWISNQVVGALTVYYNSKDDITPNRLAMAAALCEMVSAAVDLPKELDDISKLCSSLGLLADRDKAAQLIAATTQKVMKCQAVEVHTLDESIRALGRNAVRGEEEVSPDHSPCADSARKRAIDEGKLAIVAEKPSSFFGAHLAASAPILIGNEVIGVVTVLWKNPEDIWPGAWQILETMVTRVAPQLQNIMLITEQRHIAQLMAGVGPDPRKPIRAKDVISNILKTVRSELGLRSLVLYLWRDEESAYVATEAYGFKRKQPMLEGRWCKFRLGEGLVGQAAKEEQILTKKLHEEDVSSDSYFRHLQTNMKAEKLKLCIALPLGSHRTSEGTTSPVGVMVLADEREGLLDQRQPFRSSAGAALSGLGQRIQLYLDWLRLDEMRTSVFLTSAHQLLAPIGVIGGYIETIAHTHTDLSPTLLRSARASIVQAMHMANVQIHANKIAEGFASSIEKEVNLYALAKEVVESYKPLAEKRGVQLEVSSTERETTVFTSPVKVRAIFDNLCSNAVEYCRQGDRLKVTIGKSRKRLKLIVEDSGPGMPLELVSEFVAGHLSVLSPYSSGSTGLGMGLAIVQNYSRDLGWDCKLRTIPNKGTFFEFSIPFFIPHPHKRRQKYANYK